MSIVTNPDPIITQIATALRALDGTRPVIGLGGAHAKGQADQHSDIDFYVFATDLPGAKRLSEDLASRLPGQQGKAAELERLLSESRRVMAEIDSTQSRHQEAEAALEAELESARKALAAVR